MAKKNEKKTQVIFHSLLLSLQSTLFAAWLSTAQEGKAMHVPRSGKITVIHKTRGSSARHEKIISLTGNQELAINNNRPDMHNIWDTDRSKPHQVYIFFNIKSWHRHCSGE